MRLTRSLLPLAALAALTNVADAQVIVGASSVTASAGLPAGYSSPTSIDNLIDQSGLSANYVSGVTPFAPFVATTTATYSCTTGCFDELGGVAGMPASLYFDLGSAKTIGSIVVWNQAGSASLQNFDLIANGSTVGSFVMPGSSQNFPQPAQVFSFAPVTAQTFEMRITSNFGYPDGTILNEVAFEQVSSVPEPGTWALLATGLAGLAGIARRRHGSA